jgi:hypothetical protein
MEKEMVTTKTVKEVKEIENIPYVKKIILRPHEAEMLLNKNVAVYEELVEFEKGFRKIYCCFVNINALATVAQKQTGEV